MSCQHRLRPAVLSIHCPQPDNHPPRLQPSSGRGTASAQIQPIRLESPAPAPQPPLTSQLALGATTARPLLWLCHPPNLFKEGPGLGRIDEAGPIRVHAPKKVVVPRALARGPVGLVGLLDDRAELGSRQLAIAVPVERRKNSRRVDAARGAAGSAGRPAAGRASPPAGLGHELEIGLGLVPIDDSVSVGVQRGEEVGRCGDAAGTRLRVGALNEVGQLSPREHPIPVLIHAAEHHAGHLVHPRPVCLPWTASRIRGVQRLELGKGAALDRNLSECLLVRAGRELDLELREHRFELAGRTEPELPHRLVVTSGPTGAAALASSTRPTGRGRARRHLFSRPLESWQMRGLLLLSKLVHRSSHRFIIRVGRHVDACLQDNRVELMTRFAQNRRPKRVLSLRENCHC
mmetsp:Transcript_20799/g.67366  ORF Transcript_20799/g.67366 Transcript_20799/m.67366 type:complete len:404 (+) Transcript_20799:65-1276(+)